jgi:hypothetical protein
MGSYGNANLKVNDDDPWCPVSRCLLVHSILQLRLDDFAPLWNFGRVHFNQNHYLADLGHEEI